NWWRPWNRSSKVAFPSPPRKSYRVSTGTIGSRLRLAASASPRRMCAFSSASSSSRASRHASYETMGGSGLGSLAPSGLDSPPDVHGPRLALLAGTRRYTIPSSCVAQDRVPTSAWLRARGGGCTVERTGRCRRRGRWRWESAGPSAWRRSGTFGRSRAEERKVRVRHHGPTRIRRPTDHEAHRRRLPARPNDRRRLPLVGGRRLRPEGHGPRHP